MSLSFNKDDFNLKNILKRLLIMIYALVIIYLSYFKKISNFITTILLIILGTIIIIQNWPLKHASLFKIMVTDDLNKFKDYLSKNNLSPKNIHNLKYAMGKPPIIYAIEQRAIKIFKYLIENGYNLNYASGYSQPPLVFAAHSGTFEFVEFLLKHKDKFDIYAKNKDFNANALEMAIWRSDSPKFDKRREIEALLNAGMKFSISSYKKTRLEFSDSFESISLDIKKILAKRYVLDKVKNQLNMIEEIDKKKSLRSFDGINIYWKDYLDFA